MHFDPTLTVRNGMAVALFLVGFAALAAGLWTILAREYQQTLKGVATQSNRLHARAMSEIGALPVLDASARLVESVNTLIRTAMGVGAFLCLLGLALCLVALYVFA